MDKFSLTRIQEPEATSTRIYAWSLVLGWHIANVHEGFVASVHDANMPAPVPSIAWTSLLG